MDQQVLGFLFSPDNPFNVAKLEDIAEGHVYFRSVVSTPIGLYDVIFKVPMIPSLFPNNSYKHVVASGLRDYVHKVVFINNNVLH